MNRESFIKKSVANLPATYANALPVKGEIMTLAGHVYDCMKFKGTGTAAAVAALEDPLNGDTYRIITTGGALNAGDDEITTLVGDVVTYNGETELWEFVVSGAAINV